MTKSRRAAGLLLLGWATAGTAAGPVTADQAMARYREAFQPVEALRCPRGAEGDEIIVCGRREGPDPNRLPLPVEREPGERVHLLPGEPPSASVALARTDRSACEAAGPNHSCGGSISLLSILFGLIHVAKAAHDRHAD
jgi:hypothetical protein